jgi:hypothetical protein
VTTVDNQQPEDPSLCYRKQRCADARRRTNTLEDGTTIRVLEPAIATTPGLLCRTDTSIVHTAIHQLPMDYLELTTLLGKTMTIEAPTSGTRELPVPLRLGVAVLADQILDELERWAEALAESTGMWYQPGGTRWDRLRTAGGWCAGLFNRLLQLPAAWHERLDPEEQLLSGRDVLRYQLESGMRGALQLLDLHERTTALAGRTQRAERLQAPCPHCHRLALERQPGASHVDCLRCGYRTTLDGYEKSASVLAANYERNPRSRPEPKPRTPPVDRPVVWADHTVHPRVDAGSNMMLRYLERHDAAAAAEVAA